MYCLPCIQEELPVIAVSVHISEEMGKVIVSCHTMSGRQVLVKQFHAEEREAALLAKTHKELENVFAEVIVPCDAKRNALDGQPYSESEFVAWYGEGSAEIWKKAALRTWSLKAHLHGGKGKDAFSHGT